jgi:Arc/MetJ-type ribon-helix-helix transcriptional regulator
MPDSEKITINMSAVDLGKIDLLVQEGLYSNRTDFIRMAIRSQMEKHSFEVQQSVTRHAYGVGAFSYSRKDLERRKARGEHIDISVVGMVFLADDIPASLADDVIETIKVLGVFRASPEVKAALADRMKSNITIE